MMLLAHDTAPGRGGWIAIDGPPDAPAPDMSFDELWRSQRVAMLQLAVMLVDHREPAEDVVQEAFAGLHRRWHEVDAPVAYLRRSVVNGCRSVLRRRRLARLHLVTAVDRPADGADIAVLVADEHRAVLRALGTLARRQREILVLKYWSDLTDPEIAAELGISASAVRAGATRGRQQLAAALGQTS